MTSKDAFTEDEWVRLRRAPVVAGMAISIADPGGPIELTKETLASLQAAGSPPSNEELLTAVSQDILSMTQQKQNPIGDYKLDKTSPAGAQVVEELRGVHAILSANATPAETEAFGRWMVAVTQAAADAAKEGGFMGFGAERVSAGEQEMLTRVAEAFGIVRVVRFRDDGLSLERPAARCRDRRRSRMGGPADRRHPHHHRHHESELPDRSGRRGLRAAARRQGHRAAGHRS